MPIKKRAIAVTGQLNKDDCAIREWIIEVGNGQFQLLSTVESLVYSEAELEDLAHRKFLTLLDTPQHVEADTIAWHLGHQWKEDISTLGSINIELPSTKTAVGELFVSTVHEANVRRKTMTEALLKRLDQAASALLHSEDREELIPATQALIMLCSSRNQELMWELGPRLSALYLLASKPEHAHNVWRYRFKKHLSEHDYEERVRRVQKMWSFQRHTPVEVEPLTSEHIFDLSQLALNQDPTPTSLDQPFLNIKGPFVQKPRDIPKWVAAALLKTQLSEKP